MIPDLVPDDLGRAIGVLFLLHVVLPPVLNGATGWFMAKRKDDRRQLRGLSIGLGMTLVAAPTSTVAAVLCADHRDSGWAGFLGAVLVVLVFMGLTAWFADYYATPPEQRRTR